MSVEMISLQTLVDWLPSGLQYEHEFCAKSSCKPQRYSVFRPNNRSWKTRKINGREEEIYINENRVVWTLCAEVSHSFPRLVIEAESPVLDAFWASFFLPARYSSEGFVKHITADDVGRLQSGLAVFEAERLTFVDNDGEQYTARLPCRLSSAWPLETCILLERQPTSEELLQNKWTENKKTLSATPNSLFTMFSLTHPLDEAAPVLLKIPLPGGGSGVCFVSDINLNIITVIASMSLVLTRHQSTGLHSLWQLEKAVPEDYVNLYEVGVDGRACVAPHALNQFLCPTKTTFNRTNIDTTKVSVTAGTIQNFAALNSPGQNSTLQNSTSSQTCLSPFAASLSRLISDRHSRGPLSRQSTLNSVNLAQSPNRVLPQTPISLTAHISRMSSVSAARPNISTFITSSSVATNLRKTATMSSQSALINGQLNHTIHTHMLPCSGTPVTRNSTPAAASNTAGGPVTPCNVTGIRSALSFEQAEDLLDEPLLPKVCLKLVWTEPPPVDYNAKRVRWNSAIGRESPIAFSNFDVISGSTPTNAVTQPCGNSRDPGDLSVTSRFRIGNKRLSELGNLTLATEPFPVSPLVTSQQFPRAIKTDLPEGAKSSVTIGKEEQPGIQGLSNCRSIRRKGFLALDFVSVPWICFLTSFGALKSNRPSCLACLRVRSRSSVTDKTETYTEGQQPVITSERLKFLPAVDAVYIEDTRLIACLDPPTGIVLYSGIQKICLLGASPPPVLKTSFAFPGAAFAAHITRESASHLLPVSFVIRPNIPELNRWRDNAISDLLDEVESVVCGVLEQDRADRKEIQLMPNELSRKTGRRSVWPVDLSVNDCNYMQSSTPLTEASSLCDPCGNAFTLVSPVSGSSDGEACEPTAESKFSRIYLPKVTNNELVQRCLSSLHHSLPHDVSLQLFSRWYVVSHAPGSQTAFNSGVQTAGDSNDNCDEQPLFHGPLDWVRFARFILETCGLRVIPDETGISEQGLNPLGSSVQIKRCRSSEEQPCDADWKTLLQDQSLNFTGTALLSAPGVTSSPVSQQFVIRFRYTIRRDTTSQLVLSHMPTILSSFHLLYEELRLNCVLSSSLQFLAELNLVLSRVLNLPAYEAYYNLAWPDLSVDIPPMDSTHGQLIWPSSMPTRTAPCLLTWLTQQLELPVESGTHPPAYVHLEGVNDLAVALAGMILAALHADCLRPVNSENVPERVCQWLTVWKRRICTLISSNSQNLALNPVELTTMMVETTEAEVSELVNRHLPPLPKAFVQSMLNLSEMRTREDVNVVGQTNTILNNQLVCTQQSADSQHAALLFLSHLGENCLFDMRGGLTGRLRSLPRSLSTILRILLSRCRANPPPNCTPRMYSLMGRNDLARQAELTVNLKSIGKTNVSTPLPRGPLSQQPLLSENNRPEDAGLLSSSTPTRPGPQDYSSSWTTAERWANLVKPFRPTPPSEKTRTRPNGRHALLRSLESNPACQVAFKDDLRLREAYRLLQATSHIRLPRLSADGTGPSSSPSGGGSSGIEGSRFNEPRLEMHLAAAGIRVWASAIGRGMLGLNSLVGFRIPTQLRVPPICLRGRAVSPSSGRPVLVDLARESLTNLTAGNPAQVRTGTGIPDAAIDLGDRRTGTGLTGAVPPGSDLTGSSVVDEANSASNHPGNSMALAIASAVAASGAGASLRTTTLTLPRMRPDFNFNVNPRMLLSFLSTNAASSTASLLATANLQQTPAVLAAKHWPDFHNGVAVGLSISPHASVDATWIMYNCRLAGTNTDARRNSRGQVDTSSTDLPTPEQAGLLYGLGLNGHLNKMTPYDIGEYLVRVHDLHNMAVLLGLCAGKRGTMDQSVLRLLAVHYRPLLPSDPLVHVQLSVPSLCQAAAVFGLGLLYQGSAHRHITNLLITELGRSLSGSGPGGANRKGGFFAPDGDTQQSVSNAPHTNSTNPTTGWTGAAGTGGFAGDSCELIALSAGLALGLVLLQRGDTSCGLSDLAWAEKLHAYMLGSPREVTTSRSIRSRYSGLPQNFDDEYSLLVGLRGQLQSRRGPTTQLRPGSITGPLSPSADDPLLIDRYERSDASYRLFDSTSGLPNLSILMDDVFPGDFPLGLNDRSGTDSLRTPGLARTRGVAQPYPGGIRTGRVTTTGVSAISSTSTGPTTTGNTAAAGTERPTANANEFARRERRARSHIDAYQSSCKNAQIRELDCYNMDVSAPGAIMALGMAYLGTGNTTISQWLSPPTSLAQLELVRPDLFLFRALAHALVNWNCIEPNVQWIQSFCSSTLLERMQELTEPILDFRVQDPETSPSVTELSSEDDVENRCPNPNTANSVNVRRTMQRYPTSGRGQNIARETTVNNVTTRRRRRGQLMAQTISPNTTTRIKRKRNITGWEAQFLPDTISKVDEDAISLTYLYILTGRAFALGLRYAGTCHAAAANTLFELAQSILKDTWWPPNGPTCERTGNSSERVPLPKPAIEFAVSHCLLALAMVLAGSGNLTVLRLIRQLRAIRMFRAKSDQTQRSHDVPVDESQNLNRNTEAPMAARTAEPHQAAAAAAAGSSSANVSGSPVSVAAVLGTALGPSFGLQMVYASVVGLLFLGGGRLTLSNTPEAAAILCISFFPILPDHSGDNWYHLQALRHLYVLATRPRRLCAVDVDTGRVVLSNMRAKLQATNELITSVDTLIFPTNTVDDLSWIEVNRDSDKYWPTLFHKGTTNWKLLECAFQETGFLFVKRKDATEEITFLKPWIDGVGKNWCDLRYLSELKLVAAFLKRFSAVTHSRIRHPTANEQQKLQTQMQVQVDLYRAVIASVTQQFIACKQVLIPALREDYLKETAGEIQHPQDHSDSVRCAFQFWFTLPPSERLHAHLKELGDKPAFSLFLQVVRAVCPETPVHSFFWLYSFLYCNNCSSG